MKKQLLYLICLVSGSLVAQETQQISTGPGYGSQSFANLETGTEKKVSNSAWDIAFTVSPEDAGIFINESVGSGAGLLPIELYYTLSGDFAAEPDPDIFTQFPLMNIEKSWSYGAFNETRSPGDPEDYGWGYYNPAMQEIVGSNVFVVRLRDDTFLKIQIQLLSGGVYTFRYANLDGSNEINRTIAKADHAGKLLAYYSFTTDAVVDVEHADGFDFLFCRYTDLLPDPGGGDPIPYLVTGILTGGGIEVAQADGVDPDSVMFADFQGDLSPDIGIIGQDWKFFDLGGFQWLLVENRVYFVKTATGRVWKIKFTAFGGSTTGTATFEKTDLGILSSVKEARSPIDAFDVFPNPVTTEAHVLFSLKSPEPRAVQVQLLDAFGRVVVQHPLSVLPGLNACTLPMKGMTPGVYYASLVIDGQNVTRKIYLVD